MKKFTLIAVLGVLCVAGCGSGDSEATDAANEAAAAATEAQEQLAELQEQVQEQELDMAAEKRAAKKAAKAAATKAAKKARAAARVEATQAAVVESEPEPSSPPDVVGLTLPAAQSMLRSAGYKTDATNTDTMFGIMDPSNYTICKQDSPRGNLVPVLAQKYGC